MKHKCGKTVFPDKGEVLEFRNYEKLHDTPFIIYADFECYLEPVDNRKGKNTRQFQKHKPSGYSYLIKCFDDDLFPMKIRHYTKKSEDEDISKIFIKSLEKDVREIFRKFKFPKRIVMRDVDEKDFEHAKKCYACRKEFKDENEKIRDHCHHTGKY